MKTTKNSISASSKIKFDEHEDDDSFSEEEVDIPGELADLTFEEMQQARSNGELAVNRKKNLEKKGGRANKNRPMEVSAKKPVGRFREIIQVPKKVVRDPRFELTCGILDEEGFKTRYNFLYENELPAEREELKKLVKKSNDPEEIAELKNRISWIDKQLKPALAKRTEKEILAEHKKKEKEAAKHGKKPFYLKKSEIRKQLLTKKYEELKASGKLKSYIDKRRKRLAAKDRRYMPYGRSRDSNEQPN